MYKPTRTLITERQKFCKAELMVVSVKKTPTGKLNDCTNNALDATEEGDEVRTITGSLVHPYDASTNTTEIVQHWWNMNSDGTYFDTTPGITDDCEYVKDMDLIYYFSKNTEKIDNNVALSLILSDNKFIGIDEDKKSPSGIKRILISSLETEVLYRHKT